MSIRLISAVLENFEGKASLKLTLISLADHANDSGSNCYPSMAKIAKRICRSESQARRNVHTLISLGYISVQAGTENGGHTSPRYLIDVNRIAPSTDANGSTSDTPVTGASPALAPVRVTPSTHDTRIVRIVKEPYMAESASNNFFNEFWKAYPKKVKKPHALKAFRRIKPDRECLNSMIAALTHQKASTQWLEASGKYIPHPENWLNNEQWKDSDNHAPKTNKLQVAI